MKSLNTKSGFFVLFAVLLFLFYMNCAKAVEESPNFDIVPTSQSPYPAGPGQNFNIEIEIQNSGNLAKNRVVEIITEEPFELLPSESATKTFGTIGSGSSVTASYNLFIKESALTGNYEIEFRIYPEGEGSSFIKETITINVQGRPELMVTSVQTEPESIEPGGMATLTFDIQNIGTGTARKVKAELNSSSDYLVPVLSSGMVYVGNIEPGNTSQAELRMSIDSSADYKTYMTTLTLHYNDENNTAKEEIVDIGIPVTGSINLEIIQIETDFERNELEIQVANKGSTTAKSVEAKLIVNGNSVGIDYISQLKASKYTTFNFPLVLQGSGYLEIEYISPTLESVTIQEEILLNYPDPRTTNTIATIMALFIALFIMRLIWKKYKMKKMR